MSVSVGGESVSVYDITFRYDNGTLHIYTHIWINYIQQTLILSINMLTFLTSS